MRTGSDYLRSLNDGRQVFIDGERVKDVTAHVAFREAARSLARLYDIAAAPQMRELMTFISPKTGEPVLRAYQIPRSHADLRARRLFSETWAEATFGLMGRTPDHKQSDPTLYAGVVKERDDGIVISGAQQLATGGTLSDVIHLSCIHPLQPGDENYANCLAVPVNAPGVKLYPRRPFAIA